MEELAQHIKEQVSISDSELEVVLCKFQEKYFKKKEHLLDFDRISKYEFFVKNGCLRTYIADFNGVEHNIFFSIENWWAGDLQSFIKQTPATYNIQALEDSTVLAIKKENWDFIVNDIPKFSEYSRTLFRNAVISQQQRIVQNLSFTAKERYHNFFDNYPNLFQRITQKHIASYLGITPEFLSILGNYKKK